MMYWLLGIRTKLFGVVLLAFVVLIGGTYWQIGQKAQAVSQTVIDRSLTQSSAFSTPWGMNITQSDLARFHLVVRGGCTLKYGEPEDALELNAGDIIIFPFGTKHWLGTTLPYPGWMEKRCSNRFEKG